MTIIRVDKHNKKLAVEEALVNKHKDHCLCWKNCKHFNPDDEEKNCPIAQMLFEFDKKYGVTTPVWECETYEEV